MVFKLNSVLVLALVLGSTTVYASPVQAEQKCTSLNQPGCTMERSFLSDIGNKFNYLPTSPPQDDNDYGSGPSHSEYDSDSNGDGNYDDEGDDGGDNNEGQDEYMDDEENGGAGEGGYSTGGGNGGGFGSMITEKLKNLPKMKLPIGGDSFFGNKNQDESYGNSDVDEDY